MRSRLVGIALEILVMAILISVILLFIGIGVLVLVHVCTAGRSLGRSSGDENARREGRNNGGSGLSPGDLEKLPCYDYAMPDKEGNAAECAVCLEMFRAGDRCRLLTGCKHSFHADCVDSWLLRTAFCPTCRTSATKREETESTLIGISPTADPVHASP